MARYKVLQRSFINNTTVEEGAEVEWDGIPGANLEPIDEPAKAAKGRAKQSKEPLEVPEDWNTVGSLAGTSAAQ